MWPIMVCLGDAAGVWGGGGAAVLAAEGGGGAPGVFIIIVLRAWAELAEAAERGPVA